MREQPRRRVDFLQAKVDNYTRIQHEIENPAPNISLEREMWLVARATALAIDIDQVSEMYLAELIKDKMILRSGHTAH